MDSQRSGFRAWWGPTGLAAIIAAAAFFGGCEADVEEDCTGGRCGGATVAAATTIGAATVANGAGGGGAECEFSDTGDMPCDVYGVVSANCHPCHNDPQVAGAPFPLLTWENFQFVYGGRPVWDRADVAIEVDALPRMPFGLDPLPEDQRAILNAWFETCKAGECAKAAAEGTGGSASTATGSGGNGGSGGN